MASIETSGPRVPWSAYNRSHPSDEAFDKARFTMAEPEGVARLHRRSQTAGKCTWNPIGVSRIVALSSGGPGLRLFIDLPVLGGPSHLS